ncbi:MAG: hypothetical protein ACXW1W_06765 [Methylococcaceae bacterium]
MLNKSRASQHLAWQAILLIIGISQAAAEESQQNSNSSSALNVQQQADETPIAEGRNAVNFYSDQAATSKDEWRLSNEALKYPIAPVDRLQPLLELGDPFLGNGPIRPGIKTPTGQMLQPSFLLYGTLRSALQTSERNDVNTSEWSNRLDLHGNLHLSGTERLLFSLRPLDSEAGNSTGYNFEPDNNNVWREDFNARVTKLYFEGELGEIFPGLDPSDSHTYDVGFSVGRQRMQLQDGMLMNDIVDMVGITRNSLAFTGVSNLRITGIYGWNHVNRGNNDETDNSSVYNNTHAADIFGLTSEADTALNNTVALDLLYVSDSDDENAWYVGAASTQRFGWLNSTFRVNASIPERNESLAVGEGVLLLSQLSSTLPKSDNLVYFNTFWNIDRFTSAARSPDQGGPAANLGILYGPVGMGRYSVPLGQSIDDTVGTSLGYQMFLDGIDSQLIIEAGARTSTNNSVDNGALGLGARYQRTIGKRHVLRFDTFVAGQEGEETSYGLRTEWMIKF